LEINLDFGKLSGYFWNAMPVIHDYQVIAQADDHKSYWDYRDPGYTCGFFDEKISIEKPGNYLVKLFLFKRNDGGAEDQVITGKRVFTMQKSIFRVKIGDMRKSKGELPKSTNTQ